MRIEVRARSKPGLRHMVVMIILFIILSLLIVVNDAKGAEQAFRVALSISPFAEYMMNAGIVFEDEMGNAAGTVRKLQELLMDSGGNEMFIRIATDRYAPTRSIIDHSLERGLKRARLAAELGIPINPEIMGVHHYGDVTGQPAPDFSEYPEINVPGAWETLSIKQIVDVLRQYGALVAKEIKDTGAKVLIWDIGNEVNWGFAGVAVQPYPGVMKAEHGENWYRAPDGVNPMIGRQSALALGAMDTKSMIAWAKEHLWPYQAAAMNAVREGILSVVPDAKFSTHITFATNTEAAIAFYRAMIDGGFSLDELGFSYYPSAASGNQLDRFQSTASAVYEEFGLLVFVAEYAYPAARPLSGPYMGWSKILGRYRFTLDGQADLLRDLAKWGAESGVLSGIRPWAPELVSFGWEEFALFEVDGTRATARPALRSIMEGLNAAGK